METLCCTSKVPIIINLEKKKNPETASVAGPSYYRDLKKGLDIPFSMTAIPFLSSLTFLTLWGSRCHSLMRHYKNVLLA